MDKLYKLIDKLEREQTLKVEEYEAIINGKTAQLLEYVKTKADAVRQKVYGNEVFIRGLIEVSNYCLNDCYYCGIRKSNRNCERYSLGKSEILECCKEGYALGFRTFVLQGGEGVLKIDLICDTVREIKRQYPDCAVTLSLGEYSCDEYKKMREAGADRYLLRHETADSAHYEKLHPKLMSFDNRIRCLNDLKRLGFQVGCGFMVGSPYQTAKTLAKDLKFIEEFSPDMCGVGPYITHKDTPFSTHPSGTLEDTLFLLSLIRLIKPNILLPSTTALGTIDKEGREKGILHGANVVMPNLSPKSVRKKYELYNGKISTDLESAGHIEELKNKMESIGFKIVTSRGDIKKI